MRRRAATWAGLAGGALLISLTAVAATSPAALTEVRLEGAGAETLLELRGAQDAVYAAYRASDPERLVVELPNVRPESIGENVPGVGDLVENVKVFSDVGENGEAQTRLEIALSQDVSYDVWSEEGRMMVRLAAVGEPATETPAEAPAALAEVEEVPAEEIVEATAPAVFQGLDVEKSEAGTTLVLRTSRPPETVDSFVLEHPDRLVIDMLGASDASPRSRVEIGEARAARARIGAHPGKVRVVVDGGGADAPFDGHRVETTPRGLVVQLAPAPELAAAQDAPTQDVQAAAQSDDLSRLISRTRGTEPETAPAAELAAVSADTAVVPESVETAEVVEVVPAAQDETPMAEPVVVETEASPAPVIELVEESPAPVEPVVQPMTVPVAEPVQEEEPVLSFSAAPRIDRIEVERDGVGDRVTISANVPVEYRLIEPDPDTLMLSLPGVTLEPDAQVHLAPEGRGPVSLVSAFEQPDMQTPEARVVLTRAAGLVPRVTQIGTSLLLDFPVVQEASAATPPPVITAAAEPSSVPGAMAPPASLDTSTGTGILEEGGFSNEKAYTGRRISLDFKDVEINDVLRLIAEVSDLNIISGDEVQGKVTIRLVDVPWDQALDVILLTKSLGFERVGNVLRIAHSEILKQEEEARLQERRAKEKLEDLVVKLQPVNYADVVEVEGMVKRLLSDRGTVNTDTRTSTVIMKDIPSVIDEATALIKSIDTQTPQVLIESKIVEASLDYSRELGSQWAVGFQPFNDAFDSGSGPRRDGGGNDFRLHDQGQFFGGNPFGSNNVVVQNPITSAANGLLDIGSFLLGEKYNLEILLEAAESTGEGKVISSPRVVTLDNREAMIEQGVSIPFQTFENGDAQLEFIDAVLSLKVTPHITADKSIIMKIEVTRNAPDGSVPTPTGSPAIAKNQAKTETLVKDGQTLVLGGIYVVDKGENNSGVPFFQKIPIIGAVFKNSEVRDIRKELLIFVTPRIVKRGQGAS